MKFNNLYSSILLFLFVISTFSNAQNWNLIWADEFNTNGSVNQEKWFHQTQLPNGYSWYNNELQHYTDEIEMDFKNLCTSFHYDEVFGTVINRFLTQVITNYPLTIYGKGNQKRGFIKQRKEIKWD